MKKDKSYLLLKEPNLYKAFLTLAWPVMLANLLKDVYKRQVQYASFPMKSKAVTLPV